MEINAEEPILQPDPSTEQELDFYTIPSNARWFSWEEIHETERISLSEFFDGTSITRTPKIYKEYRDFIIGKYREDPSRRLTFTEVRKSLVGDITLLHKVFMFLEKWGLINFSAASNDSVLATVASDRSENAENIKVRAEEGPPHGVRVVVNPNSLKPVSVFPCLGDIGDFSFKSPLASHSDIFGDLTNLKGLPCSNCGGSLDSERYEFLKGSYTICVACFKNEKFGKNSKCADDFKFVDCSESNRPIWTEAEDLLLLESVLKHGNDWELVAQNVKSKTKLECISRLLIEMPSGDLILNEKNAAKTGFENSRTSSQVHLDSSHDPLRIEDQEREKINDGNENEAGERKSPPLKRKSFSDADYGSLLKQVARISGKFGRTLTTAAAEAAATSLCEENPFAEGLLKGSGEGEDFKTQDILHPESDGGCNIIRAPLSLRVRMEVAIALGAAGGHAVLLAEQEDREMGHLVRTLIETQLRKIGWKMKLMEELKKVKEKEYGRMKEVKEVMIGEWIDMVRKEHGLNVDVS